MTKIPRTATIGLGNPWPHPGGVRRRWRRDRPAARTPRRPSPPRCRRSPTATDLHEAIRTDAREKIARAGRRAARAADGATAAAAVPVRSPTRRAPAPHGDPAPDAGGPPRDATDTNTQVPGVDEADVVETDGERLYLLHAARAARARRVPAGGDGARRADRRSRATRSACSSPTGARSSSSSVYDGGALGGDPRCDAIGPPFPTSPLIETLAWLPSDHSRAQPSFVKLTLLDLTARRRASSASSTSKGATSAPAGTAAARASSCSATGARPPGCADPWERIWSPDARRAARPSSSPASTPGNARRSPPSTRARSPTGCRPCASASAARSSTARSTATARPRRTARPRAARHDADRRPRPEPRTTPRSTTRRCSVAPRRSTPTATRSSSPIPNGRPSRSATAPTRDGAARLRAPGRLARRPSIAARASCPATLLSQFSIDVQGDVIRVATSYTRELDGQNVTRVHHRPHRRRRARDARRDRRHRPRRVSPERPLPRRPRLPRDLPPHRSALRRRPLRPGGARPSSARSRSPASASTSTRSTSSHLLTIGAQPTPGLERSACAQDLRRRRRDGAARRRRLRCCPSGAWSPAEGNHLAFTFDARLGLLGAARERSSSAAPRCSSSPSTRPPASAARHRGPRRRRPAVRARRRSTSSTARPSTWMERGLFIDDVVYSISTRDVEGPSPRRSDDPARDREPAVRPHRLVVHARAAARARASQRRRRAESATVEGARREIVESCRRAMPSASDEQRRCGRAVEVSPAGPISVRSAPRKSSAPRRTRHEPHAPTTPRPATTTGRPRRAERARRLRRPRGRHLHRARFPTANVAPATRRRLDPESN